MEHGDDTPRARATAEALVGRLGLEPHPEGGYFRETFRSRQTAPTERGERMLSTAVLFLVTVERPSRFHRLSADELWLFQAGAPLELALLSEQEPAGRRVLLSRPDDAGSASVSTAAGTAGGRPCVRSPAVSHDDGPTPHALVPAGVWQAARVCPETPRRGAAESRAEPAETDADSADWSLVTCVVSPGFEFDDFEMGDRGALLREYPAAEELLIRHT